MEFNLGETETDAYKRTQRATAKLLAALIQHHGGGEPEIPVAEPVKPPEPKPLWFSIIGEISRPPAIVDIQRLVAQHYGVSRIDILSPRRTDNICKPRQVAMYLSKEFTLKSLPEIGRRFGGRDHTTVLHAVRKIRSLTRTDWLVAYDVAHLEAQFPQ